MANRKRLGKAPFSGSNPLMLKLAGVSVPATELAVGECPAPAMRQRRDRGIVPDNRVGLSD